MDRIDAMRAFTAVASEHSFTGAGKRLGLSTKLVSNQVRQLEERLGVRLFDRTTRSVALTDVGRAYFDRCQGLLDQFDELETSVQDRHRRPTGRIRMTAPTSFGERSLTGALALFLEDHPGIRIDLELTNRNVSLVEEGFDLAVRIGDLPDSSMIARRLASMRVVVCAAPAYFRTHGKPETPAALVDHPCIVDTNIGRAPIWPFRVDGRLVDVKVDGPFFVNTPGAACEMALAGIGILLCPFYVAGPCIERGALEILFADQEAIDFGVYTIYPHNRHLTGRVRALVDHLAATLGDH